MHPRAKSLGVAPSASCSGADYRQFLGVFLRCCNPVRVPAVSVASSEFEHARAMRAKPELGFPSSRCSELKDPVWHVIEATKEADLTGVIQTAAEEAERFFETSHRLIERKAVGGEILRFSSTQAQNRWALGKVRECQHGLSKENWMAADHVGDAHAEAESSGVGTEVPKERGKVIVGVGALLQPCHPGCPRRPENAGDEILEVIPDHDRVVPEETCQAHQSNDPECWRLGWDNKCQVESVVTHPDLLRPHAAAPTLPTARTCCRVTWLESGG